MRMLQLVALTRNMVAARVIGTAAKKRRLRAHMDSSAFATVVMAHGTKRMAEIRAMTAVWWA